MIRTLLVSLALVGAGLSSPLAAASSFQLVNRTGGSIVSIEVRRSGTAAWGAVGGAAMAGATAAVSFSDPDCAFDLRVTLASGEKLTFAGVNLCDVTAVVLNRTASGSTWVDYG